MESSLGQPSISSKGTEPKPPEQLSDEELAARYQATAEMRYFEVLWRRHAKDVIGRCVQFLRDRGAAEDVASETFLAALNKAHTYRAWENKSEGFGAWIRTIAKHLCISHLRSGFVRFNRGGTEALADEAVQESDVERASQVESVLTQLAVEQRLTLKLLYLDGYSYEEIARLQGWTVKQVKTYAQNGRRMFLLLWQKKAGT